MNNEVGIYFVPKYLEMLLSATASLVETIKWQAFANPHVWMPNIFALPGEAAI